MLTVNRIKNITCTLVVLVMIVAFAVMYINMPNDDDSAQIRTFALIIGVTCVIIAGIMLYFALYTDSKLEVLFLAAYLALGMVYNFVITPFSVPDEFQHWRYVTGYTNYIFLEDDNKHVYDQSRHRMPSVSSHYNNRNAYKTIIDTLLVPDDSEGKLIEHRQSQTYPLQYAIPAIGLTVGKLLPTSKIMEFYLGRLFNIVFTGVILFFAVKIIPKYKATVIVISLLPMFLQQSASYSYDVFINAMSILLVALLLREIYDKDKLKTNRYVVIVLVSVLLAPAKYVYALLIFLILLIPKERFNSKTDYFVKAAIAVVLTFVSAIYIYSIATPLPQEGSSSYNNLYNNADILGNPMHIFNMFINTSRHYLSLFITSCFGSRLSGFNLIVNTALIYAFIILFCLTIFGDEDENPFTLHDVKLKLMSLLIIFGIYLGVNYSLLVGWTPKGFSTIAGIQGRYFIPLLLPVAILLRNKIFVYRKSPERIVLPAAVVLNVFVVYDVLQKTVTGY